MTDVEANAKRIAATLRDCMARETSLDEAIQWLLAESRSRAVGLWRLEGSHLHLLGFCGAPDMAAQIVRQFSDATRDVPLTQTSLGIVKAAIVRQATVATVKNIDGTMGGSASWLERFEAVNSLAVPIFAKDEVAGVLAMSTAIVLHPEESSWRLLIRVAELLSG